MNTSPFPTLTRSMLLTSVNLCLTWLRNVSLPKGGPMSSASAKMRRLSLFPNGKMVSILVGASALSHSATLCPWSDLLGHSSFAPLLNSTNRSHHISPSSTELTISCPHKTVFLLSWVRRSKTRYHAQDCSLRSISRLLYLWFRAVPTRKGHWRRFEAVRMA